MPKSKSEAATAISPTDFIARIEHNTRRTDAETLLTLFAEATGLKPDLRGTIIGYGRYQFKYENGRDGEGILTGFSPRKSALSIYIMPGYKFGNMPENLERLGKHKIGKSCLYINKLADVDQDVLREIVKEGVDYMREKYETWGE